MSARSGRSVSREREREREKERERERERRPRVCCFFRFSVGDSSLFFRRGSGASLSLPERECASFNFAESSLLPPAATSRSSRRAHVVGRSERKPKTQAEKSEKNKKEGEEASSRAWERARRRRRLRWTSWGPLSLALFASVARALSLRAEHRTILCLRSARITIKRAPKA